jgi:hypothetical protein
MKTPDRFTALVLFFALVFVGAAATILGAVSRLLGR